MCTIFKSVELRKQKEVEYYDRKAKEWFRETPEQAWQSDFEGFNPFLLKSYKFLQNFLKGKCQGKKILDYGCGNGIHSVWLAKYGANVIGIDLSETSLEIAKERAKREGVEQRIKFLKIDCEKMKFPEDFFDIIFDGGTFSSLDLKVAYPELTRVLKPEGFLIGIETFGHNPFTNLKRKINQMTGKRTSWAVSHIFQTKDLKAAEKYFNKIETNFFHLVSWLAFPFLGLSWGKIFLNTLEKIDEILFKIPFLRKYAFKIVFIFSEPRK